MTDKIFVSPNQRFLMREDGSPFFWLADTAWELFHRCALEEADHYLENRRQKGFTVIQAVILAELDGVRVPNANGDLPFHNENPSQPDEAYFRHVDAILDLAEARGLYLGLLPTWGDKVNLQWGVGPVVFSDSTLAHGYGKYLGERYRQRANIIWVLGGDRDEVTDGVDYAGIWRAMAAGIQDGVGGHTLMTYHPRGGQGSSMVFHHDKWLDFNMWQSGHSQVDTPTWEMITADYERLPTKPVLDGEPNYEDHPVNPFSRQWLPEYGYFNDYDVRKQAYRAVFAGACGHTYGHHSIWQMYNEGRQPINFPYCTWTEALDRPGASQIIHLRRLMESRPYFSRIPDQSLLASEAGEGAQHVRATRCEEGRFAMVYVPDSGRTLRVDLSNLCGQTVKAWWYNPRTGQSEVLGSYFRDMILEVTSPANSPDWVLVLDDHAQGFGPPGATVWRRGSTA